MATTGQGEAERTTTRTSFWAGLAIGGGMALLLGAAFGTLQAHSGAIAAPIPAPVVGLAGAGVVGLLLGLAGRFLVRGWSGLLRYLVAVLALAAWIALTEVVQAAWAGSDLIAGPAAVDNWFEAGQLGAGCLGVATAFLAGRRRLNDKVAPGGVPFEGMLALELASPLLLGVVLGLLQGRASLGYPAFPVPPLFVTLGSAGVAGLLFSLAARAWLRGRTELLRTVAVLLALVLWIVIFEITYALAVGRHPLVELVTSDDWTVAGQIIVGFQAAVVGGILRRRAGLIETGQVEVGPARQRARRSGDVRLPGPPAAELRRRSRRSAAPAVRVTGRAEDRCPYCLELVEERDARGIVTCDICHTPHHADCWEEGGARCQVPHLVT